MAAGLSTRRVDAPRGRCVQSWLVLTVSLAYIGLLFAIAWHGDRGAERTPSAASVPLLYSLSLGIYCTAWTFYGSVGRASSAGLDFTAIYIGPILMFALGWPVLAKMVRVAKHQNTVSIADFIAARYGKSQAVAALVAVVAVLGAIPYIGLQLKAVTISYDALTAGHAPLAKLDTGLLGDTALYVAGAMAVFSILFGIRSIQAHEHHRGLMRAIAFESIVKLIAFLAAGSFITVVLLPESETLLARVRSDPMLATVLTLDFARPGFWTITLLSALAILCLPRQFHVAVAENTDPADVRAAAWIFPTYLVAINLFVVPVTLAGLLVLGRSADADTFVVSLPTAAGADTIALLAFIGGLSAATSMVIVATVALSTMISNDVAMPLLLAAGQRWPLPLGGDRARLLLRIRRAAALLIVTSAYLFYRLIGEAYPLAAIGLIAFVAVAQFGPAMLGGLYWRGGTKVGALAGIASGFVIWLWTLALPTMVQSGALPASLLSDGPWNIGWLRPQALLGIEGLDSVSHATLWSLGVNLACYVVFSLLSRPDMADRRQAEIFVSGGGQGATPSTEPMKGETTFGDLIAIASRYIGTESAIDAFRRYAAAEPGLARAGFDGAMAKRADLAGLRFTERLLAGAIGSPSARVVVAGSITGAKLSRREAMAMLDEASHAILFNREVLAATLQSVSQGICVFDADLRVSTWNRRFLELNEMPPEIVRVGTPLSDITAFLAARGDYGHHGEMQTLLDRRRQTELSAEPDIYERERPDGTVLEIASTLMPDGGFVVTYTDVTERRRAAEALERRVAERTEDLRADKAEAEQANLGKTRFLAAASHDLLQPLHAARLFISALAERSKDELVDKIDASLRSVDTLLGALLDVSKLDAGGIKPQVTAIPVEPMLRALDAEFGALAHERRLRLTHVPTSAWVQSDPTLLRRILQNFVSNAIRYTRSGRVLVGCRRHRDRLTIEVWDTGPSIPEEKREEIFEEFKRLPGREDGRDRGLGLGLAIVRRIAEMLGHGITLRSRLGLGSCFAVDLPLAEPARLANEHAPHLPASDRGFGGALVLCLDNEPTIIEATRALLGSWGCEVVTANNAADALARLQGRAPRAILADYHLDEGRTGITELNAIFRALGRRIPSVIVTADHGEQIRAVVMAEGHPVLYKPTRPAALRAQLGRLLQLAAAQIDAD
jgi:Na+/proline symporter/signal transduction histidine kinase